MNLQASVSLEVKETVCLPFTDLMDTTGSLDFFFGGGNLFFSSSSRSNSFRLSLFCTSVNFASANNSSCVQTRTSGFSASRSVRKRRRSASKIFRFARFCDARSDATFVLLRGDDRGSLAFSVFMTGLALFASVTAPVDVRRAAFNAGSTYLPPFAFRAAWRSLTRTTFSAWTPSSSCRASSASSKSESTRSYFRGRRPRHLREKTKRKWE